MRKKPQEFGFGVRDVQASPVDTFSPEVVQKPQASRASGYAAGLSQLSQTLAGMAKQNRAFDDDTLEPLASAVFEMRKEGKSEAQIQKEVAESGITTQRVLKRIRKAGSFDAFLDPAFRITYDELQGDDLAMQAEASFAELDNVARDRWAGVDVNSDIEQVTADIQAMYSTVAEDLSTGLSPFALATFRKRTEASINRRVAESRAKGVRIQEQHYANLAVQKQGEPMNAFIVEDGDGDRMRDTMQSLFKVNWPNVAAADQEPALLALIDQADSSLLLADKQDILIPEDEDHQAEIQEFLDSLEESLPEEAGAFTSVTKALTDLRSKHTRNRMQVAQYKNANQRLNRPDVVDLKSAAIENLDKLSGEEDFSEEAFNKSFLVVREDFAALRSATREERDALAEKYGVPAEDLKFYLDYSLEYYRDRAKDMKDERRIDLSDARSEEDRQRRLDRMDKADMEEEQQKNFDSIMLDLGAVTDAKDFKDIKARVLRDMDNEDLSSEQKRKLKIAFRNFEEFAPQRQAVINATAESVGSIFSEIQENYQTAQDGTVDTNKRLSARQVTRIRNSLNDFHSQAVMELSSEPNFVVEAQNNPMQYAARVTERTRELYEKSLASEVVSGFTAPDVGFSVVHGTAQPAGMSFEQNGVYTPLSQATALDLLNRRMLQSTLPSSDDAAAQKLVADTVKAVPAFERFPKVVEFLREGNYVDVRGDKRKVRGEVRSFVKTIKPLLETARGDDAAASEAKTLLEDLILDSGVVGMERDTTDLMDEILEELGGDELLADAAAAGGRYVKEANTIKEAFEGLSEVLDFGTSYSSASDALRVRLYEFQPSGKYYGIYNSQDGTLNTDWSQGGLSFNDAVQDFSIWFQQSVGRPPSDTEVVTGLIGQSQIINDPTGDN
jgi:hypothetical protein